MRAGDILLKDVVDKNEGLLLAAGSELSEFSIKKLRAIYIEGRIKSEFSVSRM